MKLEYILLGALLAGPRTGYDLKKFMDTHGRFLRSNTQMSQVYRSLTTMADRAGSASRSRAGRAPRTPRSTGSPPRARPCSSTGSPVPYHPPTRVPGPGAYAVRLHFAGFLTVDQLSRPARHRDRGPAATGREVPVSGTAPSSTSRRLPFDADSRPRQRPVPRDRRRRHRRPHRQPDRAPRRPARRPAARTPAPPNRSTSHRTDSKGHPMRAIMIMFDSLNRHLLPPYGSDTIISPELPAAGRTDGHLRQLLRRILPCMPARRELHTGRYNFLHRSWGPLEPFDDSMPEQLGRAGIHTHLTSDHQHYWEDGGATYHTRYSTWEFLRGQEGDPWKGVVAEPKRRADAERRCIGRTGSTGATCRPRPSTPRPGPSTAGWSSSRPTSAPTTGCCRSRPSTRTSRSSPTSTTRTCIRTTTTGRSSTGRHTAG